MANKLYTLRGGQRSSESEDLEVYVDLDTVSTPSLSCASVQYRTVDDFVQSSRQFLSAFELSGWKRDDYDGRVVSSLSVTGWDWMMNPGGAYSTLGNDGKLADIFTPEAADTVFSYLSDDGGMNFTEQTVHALSSAVFAAAAAFISGMEAEMRRWQYMVSKLVNVNAVKNSIRQIFTWIPGERIINPEFGSNLRKYLYEPITEQNQERIAAEIRQCALRWEPRIVVDRVVNATTTDDVENNTVKLDIYYSIKGLNGKQFMYQYEYSRSKYSYI